MNQRLIALGVLIVRGFLQAGAGVHAGEKPLFVAAPITKQLSRPGEPLIELQITELRRGFSETERRTWTGKWPAIERANPGFDGMPKLDDFLNDMVIREVRYDLLVGGNKKPLPPVPRSDHGNGHGPFAVFDAVQAAERLLVLEKDNGENQLIVYRVRNGRGSEPVRVVSLVRDNPDGRSYERGVIEPSTDGDKATVRLFIRDKLACEADVDLADEKKKPAIRLIPLEAVGEK
jgi:hypothetical protein